MTETVIKGTKLVLPEDVASKAINFHISTDDDSGRSTLTITDPSTNGLPAGFEVKPFDGGIKFQYNDDYEELTSSEIGDDNDLKVESSGNQITFTPQSGVSDAPKEIACKAAKLVREFLVEFGAIDEELEDKVIKAIAHEPDSEFSRRVGIELATPLTIAL